MMVLNRSRSVPSSKKNKLRGFWRNSPLNIYFNEDWDATEKSCCACGSEGISIDAAHINSADKKRDDYDDLKNMHLLCRLCHTESELIMGTAYWAWIIKKRKFYKKGELSIERLLLNNIHEFIFLDSMHGGSRIACPGHAKNFTTQISVADDEGTDWLLQSGEVSNEHYQIIYNAYAMEMEV